MNFISFLFLTFISSSFAKSSSKDKEDLEKAIKLLNEATSIIRNLKNELVEEKELDFSLFKKGISLIQEGFFKEARENLLPFAKKKGSLSQKALYWIAFSFFEERKYEKALVSLTHFLNKSEGKEQDFESKEMIKEAKKKSVLCFGFIKRPQDACSLSKKIILEYPEESEFHDNIYEKMQCLRYEEVQEKDD